MEQAFLRLLAIELLFLLLTIGIVAGGDGSPRREAKPRSQHVKSLEEAQKICGVHDDGASGHHRISGGSRTQRGRFPSFVQVSTGFSGSKQHDCAGVIISEWMVATYSPCLQKKSFETQSIKILAGGVKRDQGHKYEVAQYCIPKENGPEHDENFERRDIAILIMKDPIKFNDNVRPACLPASDIEFGKRASVVGYGSTSNQTLAQSLHTMRVKRTEKCPPGIEDRREICFISSESNHKGNVCKNSGDAGAPVYTTIEGKQTLVGLVARSYDDCSPGTNLEFSALGAFSLKIKELETTARRECKQL